MDQQTLPGILLLLPLSSALVILLFYGALKKIAHLISTLVAIVMFCAAVIMLGAENHDGMILYPFLHIGVWQANISFLIDKQSCGMLFIVTFVGMLVHLYSLGYMKEDESKARYFGALSLFMFSMNGIVLSDNLIMMFLFWELVGLSSYLLIGHWFKKPAACDAANKAFITNRVGDFGFMAGILILFGMNFGDVSLAGLKDSVASGPLHHVTDQGGWIITLACLGLFLGAVGKSAQAPLHVWLPDAMEGPTPVSALIHAATMVAAGVYMLVRVNFLLLTSPDAQITIACIGGLTALMAALMATQQNDIKKVLAYSTLSQLGYMVMAVGLAAPDESMFHLYTHAFFKALLFLGAGAVIYSCHHEQNIWKMGGLRRALPVTYLTFVIGTAALMGIPFTSGFFSKEGILAAAYSHHDHPLLGKSLFVVGLFTAFLTAFYMTRLVVVVFNGKPRSKDASHAHEAPLIMILPLVLLAIPSLLSAYPILSHPLQAMVPHGEHEGGKIVLICSVLVLLAGFLLGTRLYKNAEKDPLNIPLLANKFYIDEFYAALVKYGQDRVAWIVNALEKIFVDGLTVRLPSSLAAGLGNLMRRVQTGSLQAYTFILGLGIIAIVYIMLFASAKH
ncbi:NADH-quinone oxidoreductase subunit L [soil metagenome]